MKVINSIDKVLDPIEKWASVFLLLGLIAVVFVQVILRAIGIPFSGADETSRLLFIWCIFIGASQASRKRKHLKIDLLAALAKNDKLSAVLNLIEDIVMAAFLILFIPISFDLIQKFLESGQQSPVLHYNVSLGYAAPAFFFTFGAIRHLENVVRQIIEMVTRKKTVTKGSEIA